MPSDNRSHRCVHGSRAGEGTCGCAGAQALPEARTEGALLEALLDALPFYMMLIDESHTVLYANQATRRALGVSPEELVGSYCPAAVHGLDQPYPHCPLEEAGGRAVTVEREYCDPDAGGWLSSAVYPAPVRAPDGKMIYAHVVRSIDQRKRAENALRERVAVETLVADVTTRLLSAPPSALGRELEQSLATLAQFMACFAAAIYVLDDRSGELLREVAWTADAGGAALPSSLSPDHVRDADRQKLTAGLRAAGLEGQVAMVPLSLDGRTAGLGVFVGGPSPRLEDERLLELLGNTLSAACDRVRNARQQQLYAEQLRSLATSLVVAEERDRRQLAADLHDSIGQMLALCIMNLSELETSGELSGEGQRVVTETRSHIEDALVGAKTLMFDLSPPSLHELGLVGAIETLLERLGPRFELDWSLDHDGSVFHLAEDQRVFLYRAVQELLTNVNKHAGANRVGVTLSQDGGAVSVEVQDDGCGMVEADCCTVAGEAPGFGLFSIRERLHHLGGQIAMSSAPGAGTRVTITMPVHG